MIWLSPWHSPDQSRYAWYDPGFDRHRRALDAEEWRDLVGAYLDAASAIATRYEGTCRAGACERGSRAHVGASGRAVLAKLGLVREPARAIIIERG